MIFTVNAIDDDYFCNGEPQDLIDKLCFNSWKRNHDIVIFDFNHPLVKEAYEKYKAYCDLCIKEKKFNYLSDVFRLYIMSKIPNCMYFDCDYYCFKDSQIVMPEIFSCNSKCFCLMANGKDLETPAKMLSVYENAKELIKDKDAVKLSGLKVGNVSPMGVHLCDFETHYFCYSNDFEHFKKVAEKYMKLFPDYKKALNLYTETDGNTIAQWLNELDLHYANGKRADIRPKIISKVDDEDKKTLIDLLQGQEWNWRFIQ